MYWGRDEVVHAGVDEKHDVIELEGRVSPGPSEKEKVEVIVPSQSNVPAGGRRWARKVD